MKHTEINNKMQRLVGQKLDKVLPICEMLRFYFSGGDGIHSLMLTRISRNDDILLTTFDYQSWDRKVEENNDEWYNLNRFHNEIIGGIVVSVNISSKNDLIIHLDNDITIEIFVANGYFHFDDEWEQWRCLFSDTSQLVVYSKSAELLPPIEDEHINANANEKIQ